VPTDLGHKAKTKNEELRQLQSKIEIVMRNLAGNTPIEAPTEMTNKVLKLANHYFKSTGFINHEGLFINQPLTYSKFTQKILDFITLNYLTKDKRNPLVHFDPEHKGLMALCYYYLSHSLLGKMQYGLILYTGCGVLKNKFMAEHYILASLFSAAIYAEPAASKLKAYATLIKIINCLSNYPSKENNMLANKLCHNLVQVYLKNVNSLANILRKLGASNKTVALCLKNLWEITNQDNHYKEYAAFIINNNVSSHIEAVLNEFPSKYKLNLFPSHDGFLQLIFRCIKLNHKNIKIRGQLINTLLDIGS